MHLKHKVFLGITGLLFSGYFGSYAYFRNTHKIVHYQSFHGGLSHRVVAVMPEGPHLFMAGILSEDFSPDDLMILAYRKAKNLNMLFYPARKIEVLIWRMVD